MDSAKRAVREFWDRAACGEELYLPSADAEGYAEQLRERYTLEPYIRTFADFPRYRGKRVLEIGVGPGADHECFVAGGAELVGIDITMRAIEHVRRRFQDTSRAPSMQADAEQPPRCLGASRTAVLAAPVDTAPIPTERFVHADPRV